MSILNLSFSNQLIADYFRGSNKYVPTSELLYIHSHPLVKPNFIGEIEVLVNMASKVIDAKNIQGPVVDKLTKLAISLGQQLPDVTQENAPKVLETLRSIHKVCVQLLKNHNAADESVPGIRL